MKKFLLATTAIVLAAPAFAADLPRRTAAAAPAPAPAFVQAMNWTGFYLGLNVGYFAPRSGGETAIDGFTVGARLGYDWQVGQNWVIGAFGDLDASFAKETLLIGTVKTPFIASLNLRAGYLITPATLLYVTGGYTYVDLKVTLDPALVGVLEPRSKWDGWNVGAGVEHRFNNNWSVFGEYRYNDLTVDVTAHTFKLGVNYRFGGAARPVVARY